MDQAELASNNVKEEYVEKMERIYQDWKESDQSLTAFGHIHPEVTYDQLLHYRRAYHPDEMEKMDREKSINWTKLQVALPSSTIDIHAGPFRIAVHSGFDKDLLYEVLEVIKS